MNLREFLAGKPIQVLVLIPVVLVVLGAGVILAASGGGGNNNSASISPTVVGQLDIAATATKAAQATAAPSFRTDCAAISGTPYQNDEERTWFLANCKGNTALSGNLDTSSAAATGGGTVGGGEYSIGARLVIPAAGVNAVVTGMDVSASGNMPDPKGYFNAVLYNFSAFPGLGGPNKIVAAHVDCAYCHNGASGIAAFYYVRNLGVGDTAQYYNPDGTVTNYVVVSSYTVSPNANWNGIVASDAAAMTLITCTGNFAGGEYDTRHVVQLAIQ